MNDKTRFVMAIVACLTASITGLYWSAPGWAVAKPAGLKATTHGADVMFRWSPVAGASDYVVQVSDTTSFSRILWQDVVEGAVATPTQALPGGDLHWRVASVKDRETSLWASASLRVKQVAAPVVTAPAEGQVLAQPFEPVVFQWEPVAGAQSYEVDIDGAERDWVDVDTFSTDSTSLALLDSLPPATYWWRVRAVLSEGIFTSTSLHRSFVVRPLDAVSLLDTAETLQDVVLEWEPVPGAASYEVRVSTDNDFNTITDQRYVAGTRYSPPVTYNNASYWWQVRAVDVYGRAEEWSGIDGRIGEFRRNWPERPSLLHPSTEFSGDPYFAWTPVPRASGYQVDVGTDPSFSSTRNFKTCFTTQTTYTPGFSGSRAFRDTCGIPEVGITYYWRVRALDNYPDRSHVNGLYSEVASFVRRSDHDLPAAGALPAVSGQAVKLTGESRNGCTGDLSREEPCRDLAQTPMLDWDPVPGANVYQIYVAHDRQLTNMVDDFGDVGNPDSLVHTTNTRFMPPLALPDTQAGEAYYWYVRACMRTGREMQCSRTPEEATNAFQKKSVEIELTSPEHGENVAEVVQFEWRDYLESNTARTDGATGDVPDQAALRYRLQVARSEAFTRDSIVDEIAVDQTSYTPFARTYPEGTLYWRVQAIDGSGNTLTWSDTRSFVKKSAVVLLRGPDDAAIVHGVQPLRWQPALGAKYYDVEIYRNADTQASPSNLAAYGRNIRPTAFTAPGPLPGSQTPYVWRVRKTDFSDNKGPWSGWRSFLVQPPVPKLTFPSRTIRSPSAYFAWTETPGAAMFRWELRRGSSTLVSGLTTQRAYAPPSRLPAGKFRWRVIALDNQRAELAASKWRRVIVKG